MHAKHRRTLAAVVGLGLAVPALAVPVTVSSTSEIQLHAGARVVEAKLTPDGVLQGPTIQVQRFGSELRGQAYRIPVRLSLSDNAVNGQLGSTPVQLQLTQDAQQGVTARGLFGGAQSDLRIQPDALKGRIGRCDYDLRRSGDYYSGMASCRGLPVMTSLTLPQGMSALPTAEQVAILGLVLSPR